MSTPVPDAAPTATPNSVPNLSGDYASWSAKLFEPHHLGTDTLPNSSHHPTSLSDHVSTHYTRQVHDCAEADRLNDSPSHDGPWRQWGPYVSARQWGTVREDYSADGNAWAYFPFEHAGVRAYRWGEDGLGAICDRYGFVNVGAAVWNRNDEMLKERLFGLTNDQGNHGEDVKEYFWTIDGTPTHSLMRWVYRYPQAAYPYQKLRDENARRNRTEREYELADTGIIENNEFFDVQFNYAKSGPTTLLLDITVTNHGPATASVDIVPQVWLRNTWSWGRDARKGSIQQTSLTGNIASVQVSHGAVGDYTVTATTDSPQSRLRDVLFCENETNTVAAFNTTVGQSPYPKDSINRHIVHGEKTATNPARTGTKAGFWFELDDVAPGETRSVRLILSDAPTAPTALEPAAFAEVFALRQSEADEFYAQVIPAHVSDEDRKIARRSYAGLLWSKQLYRYDVRQWMEGDPSSTTPPPQRHRNTSWRNFALADVISMPDEWEYPWFAAWDLAFHTVTLAHVDPEYAKAQMILLSREWSMNANGQLPAYEWEFSDVNPPVHAWSAYQIYLIDGARDKDFLARIFDKMAINFTWWVNRKDADGSGLFEGGFLGMDNISLFNRSDQVPPGLRLEQSDATSWMGFFALTMLACAVELGQDRPQYDDMATTYLEHFLHIAAAARKFGSRGVGIWDETDGFCYDVLVGQNGASQPLRVRSMVGLIPLLAVSVINSSALQRLPDFQRRWEWILHRRPELRNLMLVRLDGSVFLSLLSPRQNLLTLTRMLNEAEFLSQGGVRSLSAEYREPFTVNAGGQDYSISYVPGESDSPMFGGNSNWRGPVWFPINVLLIDALRTIGDGLGRDGTIEYPTNSGTFKNLFEVARDLENRLISLFREGSSGYRPSDGQRREASPAPEWKEHLTFYEYFNGDTGEGLGATHQTGWTALVAHLISRSRPPQD